MSRNRRKRFSTDRVQLYTTIYSDFNGRWIIFFIEFVYCCGDITRKHLKLTSCKCWWPWRSGEPVQRRVTTLTPKTTSPTSDEGLDLPCKLSCRRTRIGIYILLHVNWKFQSALLRIALSLSVRALVYHSIQWLTVLLKKKK